jgi:potassium efflux system protein
MGVGVGFGLQEIIANLVSGLLLLVEGRVRLMDVVTVGDDTGRVTAIRAMATTVTDWNNRELVIPNKEFITGRVINWTLSERVIRLDVPVGIAYGSDTLKAEEILVRVGRENELTHDDPPPRAVFLGFGASSLDFALHVWVNMEDLLKARHELHRAIDDAFRETGITIAFPQLDVHMATDQ